MRPAQGVRIALRLARSFGFRRALGTLFIVALAPLAALIAAAALQPLPEELKKGPGDASLRVYDQHGRLLRELRAEDGAFATRVRLDEVAPEAVSALLAAEDARFFLHPGLDPLAIVRALGQAAVERRIVSGASTITQQLARTVSPHPRTLFGKLGEMAMALRIEASLSKEQVLEEYLNRVEFGPNLRGIAAGSRRYFDKPPSALDLGEAATLAAMVRGPALYDPRRGTLRVERRRNRILERMRARELAEAVAIDRALAMPITLQAAYNEAGAPHLLRALASGALEPELRAHGEMQEVRTTLDLELQREVEALADKALRELERFDASAAAIVVADTQSGEVLAYLGSPNFFDAAAFGQNDGARALRQPGSALKPFVYAAAMQRLGLTAASVLPDVELHIPTPQGDYSPKNYDGRFHGPVRLREALASSLNVPAVYATQRTGPDEVLRVLHAFGFKSLSRPSEHYGAALALGDGEVSLLELVAAYATLGRDGRYRPLRFVRDAAFTSGERLVVPESKPERVLDARLSAVLTDILADDAARSSAFGAHSVLELPFSMAAKTGTSKNFRDNWAIGYTREVTVGVWVGNFDGRPLRGSSGITGAGPLLRDVISAAMRGRQAARLVDRRGLIELEICKESGELVNADCPHRVRELFTPETAPRASSRLHVRVAVDPENGLRAGPRCAGAIERVFESYPAEYGSWARAAGRPLVPENFSPRCPGKSSAKNQAASVVFPFDGARFVLDPALNAEQQRIVMRGAAARAGGKLVFVLNGRSLGSVGPPFSLPWRLEKGSHVLRVEAEGAPSETVRFEVN